MKQYRIGNWIHDIEENKDYQIEEICKLGKESINQNLGIRYANGSTWASEDFGYTPIKLTEGWLLRAGFSEHQDCYVLSLTTGFYIAYSKKIKSFFYDINGIDIDCDIKYVHQLQNLYFALTNTELTFKDL